MKTKIIILLLCFKGSAVFADSYYEYQQAVETKGEIFELMKEYSNIGKYSIDTMRLPANAVCLFDVEIKNKNLYQQSSKGDNSVNVILKPFNANGPNDSIEGRKIQLRNAYFPRESHPGKIVLRSKANDSTHFGKLEFIENNEKMTVKVDLTVDNDGYESFTEECTFERI